jgi:hypothetical protein
MTDQPIRLARPENALRLAGIHAPLKEVPRPYWRPWVALSQATYNAMDPSQFDPDIMYVVGATRIYQGENNVFPPPFGGGIVNVTTGIGTLNPTQIIPTTQPGNLVVLIQGSSTFANAANVPSAVTDNAGQVWKQVGYFGSTGAGGTQIACWYRDGSAAISQVTMTASSQPRVWWILEIAGIAATDALDSSFGDLGGNAGVQSATLVPNYRAAVIAALTRTQTGLAITARPPDPPWINLDDMATTGDISMSLAAFRVATAGESVTAAWTLGTAQQAGRFIAAFRLAEES